MEEHRGRAADCEASLSVVIPTHDRAGVLRETLGHLARSTLRPPWEVVVVANACTDDTATVVRHSAAGMAFALRLVEEPQASAAVARNRGAHAASGSLLVFLDDDILLEPEALEAIAEWHDGSDRQSLLVGRVLPLPEHLASPFGAFRQRAHGVVSPQAQPEAVDWFASGLAAVPAKTFHDLGGYAENYPAAGLEDGDFAIRARRAGYRIVFDPAVVGMHNDWAGTTARDYCRRAAAYGATAPLLAERFPDNDHPWGRLVEVNRPALATDPAGMRARKRLKLMGIAVGADRWLPGLADRVALPGRLQDVLYKGSVSLAMFAGYQRGLDRLRQAEPDGEAGPAKPGAHELSIVVCTFNCREEVQRAIESLQRHPPSVSHEIVVVDNASSDGTAAQIARRFPQVKVIALPENVGYGSAVNLAVKETDGQYLLLLNPDTETTRGALDTLLRHAKGSGRVGVVGPRLVLGTGGPQSSARRFPSPWRLWFEVLRLHLLLPESTRSRLLAGTYSEQDEPGPVDWISGACHLVPRPVWEAVGGLTERTFCGFDDLDYCWRAHDAGFGTLFCPDATIIHQCGVSVSRRWTSREVDKLAIHNAFVVLEDHWPRRRVKLYCAAELAGTVSDVVLGARRSGLTGNDAQEYRKAALERVSLLTALLLDRVRPIERHEPGKVTK